MLEKLSGLRRISSLLQRLNDSLWFLPALIVAGALALAVVLVDLSSYVDDDILSEFPRLFGASADSSRSMLSTIAGSMVTVAGVTFSILVVAVSQASTQYTPRVMRKFMRDRLSQVTLGVLVGVFAYCLIVLRTIRGGDTPFIPALAVITSIVLALFAVGLLMYFIHHIASNLEAGTIVSGVAHETTRAIDRLFPDKIGKAGDASDMSSALANHPWQPLLAERSGYIQYLDARGLLQLAAKHGGVIRMDRGIGDFVAAATALASFAGPHVKDDEIAPALNDLYVIDSYRTVHQDAGFGIRQIVDVALKALSPGINDTTTAITCIDYLIALLVKVADREIPRRERYLDNELRVIAQGPTFTTLLDEAFDEIRHHGRHNLRVLQRAIGGLQVIATSVQSPERLSDVLRQINRYRAVLTDLSAKDEDARRSIEDCENIIAVSKEPPA